MSSFQVCRFSGSMIDCSLTLLLKVAKELGFNLFMCSCLLTWQLSTDTSGTVVYYVIACNVHCMHS